MDAKSLQILEFNKVLARVAAYTSFSAGSERALALQPTADKIEATTWQAETREATRLLLGDSDVTIGGARDVRPAADNAQRGFILPAGDLLDIRATLVAARNLQRALLRHPERHPTLAALAELIEDVPGLVQMIGNTIDERGDVLDSASPKLAKLRQQLRVAYDRVHERLRALLNSSMNQYLQEPLITMRSGRYVVPLRAEFKGRIKGIVHDQSSSGATLWIEPLNTVDLNNEYRSLQIEQDKEIERILAELSGEVGFHGATIRRIVDTVAQLDVIFARARYGMATDAIEPQFVAWRALPPPHPGSTIYVRAARHPLLDPGQVIPTDFLLDEATFTVLITGPNTGGKTVALKNIGLMVLMAQSGLHLPAREARLTVFDNVCADIGDEQSIEQSLSTFSAHIRNIIRILSRVDDRTLVLLDELGSGTDPTEGAAIAQSIISFLRDKGATSLIATHYPELKVYASQTPGATNASMLFDIETLSPTYEMTIGVPGKSNALAIARRLGLDETILDDALRLVGVNNQETESLLDSIHDLREKIGAEEAAARLARKQAEQERDRLRIEAAALEYERRRILSEARAQAEAEMEEVRKEIRRARKQLRDAQSLTAVKNVGRQLTEVEELTLPTLPPLDVDDDEPRRRRYRRLREGDVVMVRSLNMRGEIRTIQGREAEVIAGRMTLRVALDDLEFRGREDERPEAEPSAISATPLTPTVSMEIDLRGERVETSLERLEQYLDQASLSDLPWVRIIHGKGTGRLRQAIRKALDNHPDVTTWQEAGLEEGGSGVTIARFTPAAQA